jgi:hypothetical protein
MEEINSQMEQENAVMAQAQQQAMIDQQAQQQQDMQNQIAFGAQQQIAQAQVQKEVDKEYEEYVLAKRKISIHMLEMFLGSGIGKKPRKPSLERCLIKRIESIVAMSRTLYRIIFRLRMPT